ncbi:hypothetical protein D3C87_1658140 [compost metagenome]
MRIVASRVAIVRNGRGDWGAFKRHVEKLGCAGREEGLGLSFEVVVAVGFNIIALGYAVHHAGEYRNILRIP